ncbi:conserved membrane protein. Putative O-antigen biosynthesis protein [Tenacibaculum maritimum]|nr:conserved membrane protein. Putative O-antigen biosynthesis protein [Tenacibaculum maritimum]
MRSENEILKEIKIKEKSLNLYSFKILGVAVWRLVRFPVRVNKINKETGFTNRTTKVRISFREVLFNYVTSFFQFIGIILRRKKYKYLVLAFPRLSQQDEGYFDKFTDPLIAQSNLKSNTLVLQRNLSGKQFSPRYNEDADYKISDFIDYTSKLIGILIAPVIYIIYGKKTHKLVKNASTYFSLSNTFSLLISYKVGQFMIHCFFTKLILSSIRVKQILVVNRSVFMPFIRAAKVKNIEVLELQHGITHSETVLYTGDYQPEIDPDIFLNFGEKWIGKQFAVPIKKQINIGWAYNTWLLTKTNIKLIPKSVLVVSSPAITDKILKTTLELAEQYSTYSFSIRLHPQEALSSAQQKRLHNRKNIVLDNKNIDSLISVLKHEVIIGENSSVVYEALSLGKKVGKIMFNGLDSKKKLDSKLEGLKYLYGIKDFSFFVSNASKKNISSSGIYDTFDKKKFNKLLK